MYVGIGTLITLHIISNLMVQKGPSGVSEIALHAELNVINTKRNHISAEHDMQYHSTKTTI